VCIQPHNDDGQEERGWDGRAISVNETSFAFVRFSISKQAQICYSRLAKVSSSSEKHKHSWGQTFFAAAPVVLVKS